MDQYKSFDYCKDNHRKRILRQVQIQELHAQTSNKINKEPEIKLLIILVTGDRKNTAKRNDEI